MSQMDRWTDGQTDIQTTYCGITALSVASRGKNRLVKDKIATIGVKL